MIVSSPGESVCLCARRHLAEIPSSSRAQLADPKGLPLSMRLLNETHRRLRRGVRGAEKLPGEVRRSQNWIGGSRPGNAAYVPPPHALDEVLGAFEKYLHSEDSLPPLVRAGLLHEQFETIHPYLDGNGRIGRLVVTPLLEHYRVAALRTLAARPVMTVASIMKLVETTKPTAGRAIDLLVAAGVLVETTGKKRDRSFVYRSYLDRLKVGTDLERVVRSKT